MLLWHDDVRTAPEGWTRARSNAEARTHLLTGKVEVLSLDHDLGEEDDDPTGLDLAQWMVENDCVPPAVYVHSWNPAGGRSIVHVLNGLCSKAGPYFVPYSAMYFKMCEQEAAR